MQWLDKDTRELYKAYLRLFGKFGIAHRYIVVIKLIWSCRITNWTFDYQWETIKFGIAVSQEIWKNKAGNAEKRKHDRN